jgi:membrane protease YdiL (CAAX protease family)
MQKERAFRILALLLFFDSVFALLTSLIRKLPLVIVIPALWVALAVCTAEIGRRYGKAAGISFALMYAAFLLLLMYVAYVSTIILAAAMLSFPFFWDVELQHKSLEKTFSYLGLKSDSFLMNAILGVATTLFVVVPLVIIEAAVVLLLHIEEPGKVSMIVKGLPLYIIVFSFTISPIAEEILFRGFLLSRVGIVVSSLLFAFAHYYYGSYTEVLAAFTAGFVFAILFKRSKSIVPSIFAHAAFNFMDFVIVALYWFHVIK